MGLGSMRVDVRDVELPPGRTDLPLEIGMGEIQVLVPDDLCVTTEAEIGMGAFDVGDGEQGGDRPRRRRRPRASRRASRSCTWSPTSASAPCSSATEFFDAPRAGPLARRDFDALETGTNRVACLGAA